MVHPIFLEAEFSVVRRLTHGCRRVHLIWRSASSSRVWFSSSFQNIATMNSLSTLTSSTVCLGPSIHLFIIEGSETEF